MRMMIVALVAVGWLVVPSLAEVLDWAQVQVTKQKQMETAAAHAVAQQRTESFPPEPLQGTWSGAGGVKVEESTDWDVDGDGKCLKVTVTGIPQNLNHVGIKDRIEIRFAKPMDFLAKSTGFALWIKTPADLSRDLRMGVYFKIDGHDGEDPVIISDTPVCQKFGDNPQQVYMDWGYAFDHSVGVFKVPPHDWWTKVAGLDLTLVQKRIPYQDSLKLEPASGTFYIDGLSLVDWYDGSYDSDRFPKGKPINVKQPIISQGRTQQVTILCARFGGEEGVKSAIRAMDMMARIQCWDGSWPEMQTRLQGEWTHGMILADLARALAELRRQERPELKEVVRIRQWEMPRDQLYEQMVYRGARSRSPAPMMSYRDTYTTGKGALSGGCNRPMIFTASQYIAAQALTDPVKKKEVLAEYDLNMNDLVASQGSTAGGWPIFGEGDRYNGKGLHWDCGYTTDHVFIMSLASRATGDKRWGEMMRKFGTVVTAMALPNGYQIDGALSERGNAKTGGLKAPDIVYQEAMRWDAVELAQWAANASKHQWTNWPTGTWAYAASARGYGLGAFLTWQAYDMQTEPQPKDLGRVFPRQWPVWTARWMDKQGQEARRSKIIVTPAGQTINTFEWEVGQYPVLEAVPLVIKVEGDSPVEIEPIACNGNVATLPEKPVAKLVIDDGGPARLVDNALAADGIFKVDVTKPTRVRLSFESNEDVEIEFRAAPRKQGAKTTLACRLLRKPEDYKHTYAKEATADVDLGGAGVNMVDPATGTKVEGLKCFPSAQYGVERAFDKDQDTAWVIGKFLAGTGLKFRFAKAVRLDKLVLSQGDWQGKFNVAKDITVTLSDGTSKKVALEKKPGQNVEVDLGGAMSDSLVLSVDSIYEPETKTDIGGWMELAILTK